MRRPQYRVDERRLSLEAAPVPDVDQAGAEEVADVPATLSKPSDASENDAVVRPGRQYRPDFDPNERPAVFPRTAAHPERVPADLRELPAARPPEAPRLDAGLSRLAAPDDPGDGRSVLDGNGQLPLAAVATAPEYTADRLPQPALPEREDPGTPMLLAEAGDPRVPETRLVLRPESAEETVSDEVPSPQEPPEDTAEPPIVRPEANGSRSFSLVTAEPIPPRAEDIETDDEAVARPEPEPEPETPVVAVERPSRVDDSAAREMLPLVDDLDASYYYVQIGAYGNPASARAAIDNVGQRYPRVVTRAGSETDPMYRVFIGPLNDDEKGGALVWFRNRGYQDAFVRHIQ